MLPCKPVILREWLVRRPNLKQDPDSARRTPTAVHVLGIRVCVPEVTALWCLAIKPVLEFYFVAVFGCDLHSEVREELRNARTPLFKDWAVGVSAFFADCPDCKMTVLVCHRVVESVCYWLDTGLGYKGLAYLRK